MNLRLISVITSCLIIVVGLAACEQITEEAKRTKEVKEAKENQKPSRNELVNEINNTCYIYANLTVSTKSPPSSRERASKLEVIERFFEFAQLNENANLIVNLLELEISMMEYRSAMDSLGGQNINVNNRNIEASCISTLRKKAL